MGKPLDWIRTNYRSYLLWGLFWSVIIVPLVLVPILIMIHEREVAKRHIPEVTGIADQLPVYPGFQRVGDDYFAVRRSRVTLRRSFSTNGQSADVRKFFDEALANAGWGSPELLPGEVFSDERYSRTYHRGSYRFSVYLDNSWDPLESTCRHASLSIL